MIPERYLNFLSEISGKFPIGNFGELPRPIPSHKAFLLRTIGFKVCLAYKNFIGNSPFA